MAQNYTRQSTLSDGDTITASLFNDEYNQLVNAFTYSSTSASSTGHRHDGSAGQGGNIFKIGDLDFLNKIEVDSTNNRWGFYVEVSSAAVEQIRIQDGSIVPVTTNDIDLGTSSLQFKDLYIDGTANVDSLTLTSGATVTTILDEDDLSSNSATALVTQQSVKAYIDAQVTAQDFDFQADSGGALSIDLDSETMTFTGGTGIDTSGSGNAVTFAIDSTVTTLTGTQTLTNKTLTSPDVNTPDIDGGTIDGTVIGGTTAAAGSFTTVSATGNITVGGTVDGRDVATDGTKLDGIESGATADQTAAEIRTLVDSATDSNVFTDADHTKLDGIEASADVTDTTNVTAAGALMDSELTSEASIKALNQGVATTDSPTFAGVTVNGNVEFDGLSGTGSVNVTDILDQDDMSSNSATALATQQSIKAYVDSQVGSFDTLAEVLAQGNTTGGTDIQFSAGDNITNASGDFTIDIAGDITLDAGGGDFVFSDDGTEIGRLRNVASGFQIQSSVSNKDLLFVGSDAGVDVTALTLDMSAAGIATFNSGINIGNRGSASDPTLQSSIDPDTGVFWGGSDILGFASGGAEKLRVSSEVVVNDPSNDVDFRVESNGQTHMLFVDAGNDAVAFGTTDIDNQNNSAGSSADNGLAYNLGSGGYLSVARYGGIVAYLNRTDSDGTILDIRKDGSTVGTLGSNTARFFIHNNYGTGSGFRFDNGFITPSSATGATEDNTTDLGSSGARFKDLYLSSSVLVNAAVPRITLTDTDGTNTIGDIRQVSDATVIKSRNGSSNGSIKFNGDNGTTETEYGRFDSNGVFTSRLGAVFNEDSADVDFRVESNSNTHALFVDAGNDRVDMAVPLRVGYNEITATANAGIGQFATATSGSGELWTDINTGVNGYSSMPSEISVMNTADNTTNTFAGIFFQAGETSAGSGVSAARIGAIRTAALSADLAFATRAAGTGTMAEHMRLTNDGKLGLGTDSPSAPLTVSTSSTTNVDIKTSATNGTAQARFSNDARTYSLGIDNNDSFFVYDATGTSTRMTIGSSETVFNESSADVDFRVESNNNANMLVVDAGTDRVGIGGTPTARMQITSDGADAAGAELLLQHANNNTNDVIATVNFANNTGSAARIRASTTGANNTGLIQLFADNAGTDTQVASFRAEEIIFNETSANIDFRVESDTNANAFFLDATNGNIGMGGTSNVPLNIFRNGAGNTELLRLTNNNTNNHNFYVYVNDDDNMVRFGSTGDNGGNFAILESTNTNDSIIFYTAGGATFNELGADSDFRVESDSNTHALFVDAGNSRVGVNVATPIVPFSVAGTPDSNYGVANFSGGTDAAFLTISRDGSQEGGLKVLRGTTADLRLYVASDENSVLNYNGGNTGDSLFIVQGAGTGALVATFDSGNNIIFNENSGDQDFRVESNAYTHMLVVDAGLNKVGINKSAPDALFEVQETSGTVFDATDTSGQVGSGATLSVQNLSDDTNAFSQLLLRTRNTSKSVSRIASLVNGTGTDLVFVNEAQGSAPSERMRIRKQGEVIIPGGVTLGTSANVHTDAKTLDDYEEGTWTPDVKASGGQNYTHSGVTARYTKIGNLVTITCQLINITTDGTGHTGYLQIRNAPFSKITDTFPVGPVTLSSVDMSSGMSYATVEFITTSGTSTLYIRQHGDNTAGADLPVSAINSGTSDITFSIQYIAA